MGDVILKEWAELSALALKLNDSDKFPVFLEMAGHVDSFYLRIGYDAEAKYFQLPITPESEILISQIDINANNIKAAKEWLTARHSDMRFNKSNQT